MLKITPVKQQTGARFYPGDLTQPGRAGAQFSAEQGFWKTFQGGLEAIGRLLDDQNKIEQDAHRNYVKGAVLSRIQDAERHAYVNAKEDGSDLYQLYDSKIAEMDLVGKYTAGKDEDEAKYLTGNILTSVARARGGILKPFIQRGTQAAERKAENTLNDMVNRIDSNSGVVDYFRDWNTTLGDTKKYSTGLVKSSFDGIKNTVVTKGIEAWVKRKLKDVTDNFHRDKSILEEPDYRVFESLDILLKPTLERDDVTKEELLTYTAYTGKNEPKEGTESWKEYIIWRYQNDKPVGYQDMQILAGVSRENTGTLSDETVVALRKDILATKNTLAGEVRLRVNDKITRDKEIVTTVETAHQLDIMSDMANNRVTTAKKKMEMAIRGESWLDDYKDNNMPEQMQGKPLVPINFMKTVDTNYHKIRDRETVKGFAKRYLKVLMNEDKDVSGVKGKTKAKWQISDLESYVKNKMAEGRFSASSATSVVKTLKALKKGPTNNKLRVIRNALAGAEIKKYLALKPHEQTGARLDLAIAKSVRLVNAFDTKYGTEAAQTAATNKGVSGQDIKGAEKYAGDIEEAYRYGDQELKVERNTVMKNYNELVQAFQDVSQVFPMGRGPGAGSWPKDHKPLLVLTGYTRKELEGMSPETLHDNALKLDNFRDNFKSSFDRSPWWKDKSPITIRTQGKLRLKLSSIYDACKRLSNYYREQAAINLKKQQKKGR